MMGPRCALAAAALAASTIAVRAQVHPPGSIEVDVVTPARELIPPTDSRLISLATDSTSRILFGAGQSRLMSSRMSIALARFAGAAPSSVNFNVVGGYASATSWPSPTSQPDDLYYEGRAVTLRYTSSLAATRAAVFSAATSAGFDFVSQTFSGATVTLRVSVVPATCAQNQLDLAFLVDGSGSISASDWLEAKSFVRTIATYQDIGSDRTRVAIATFSGDRAINPNRTRWLNETDCPRGTMWLTPAQYPESVSQVGYPSSACACEGGVSCTPSSQQASCTNLGVQDGSNFIFGWRNSGARGSCGTAGGTGTFSDGIAGGVREDLLFNAGVTRSAVLDRINSNMAHPGGFTWTSAGLERVRTRIFNTATGMRSAGDAVPRVLVVLTDGQASCQFDPDVCFRPGTAARALRDDGVTVLAVGVGSSISTAELVSIAGTSQNVFQVSQFSRLPDVSNRIDSQSCAACIALPFELASTVQLDANEYRCLRVCGPSDSVVVTCDVGEADAFVSVSQFGGPRNFTQSATGIQAGSTRTLSFPGTGFVVLKGRRAGTRVTVRFAASSSVTTTASVQLTVNDTEPVGEGVVELGDDVAAVTSEPHRFSVSSSSANYFGVSSDGVVSVSTALPPAVGSAQTLVVRATPRSASSCGSQAVSNGGSVTVVDITVAINVQSDPSAQSAGSDDNSGATAGIVIGILLLLALVVLAALLVARRNHYQCGTSGPSRVDDIEPGVQFMPVANRGEVVVNPSYTAVSPPKPPRPAPPRPSGPPARPSKPPATHGGALSNGLYRPPDAAAAAAAPAAAANEEYMTAQPYRPNNEYAAVDESPAAGAWRGAAMSNETYMPAVPERAEPPTAYVEPVTQSSTDGNYATASAVPQPSGEHYASASAVPPPAHDYATADFPDNSAGAAGGAAFGVGSAATAGGDQGAIVNDTYVSGGGAATLGAGAAGAAAGDQGGLVNETYLPPDEAPPPRAPPVPKSRPAAAPTPAPRRPRAPATPGADPYAI